MTIPHYINEDGSDMGGHQARLVRNGRRRKTLFGAVFEPLRMPEQRHSGIQWIDPPKDT